MGEFRHYPPGGGQPLRWQGHEVEFLTTGDESAGRYCLEWGDIPPGGGPPPNIQTREDEAFYVLRGTVAFTAGDRSVELGPGGIILIRRGTTHVLKNVGTDTAEVLCLNAPAGFDRFQMAVGDDPAKLEELAPDFGIDLRPPADAFRRSPDVLVRTAADGTTVWAAGDRYRFLLTGDDTGGAVALWEAYVPPGGGPPRHVHSREDEAFYVLEGELEFTYADRTLTAGPGSFLNLPPGTPHKFHNSSGKPALVLLLVCPAGLERMFFEVGTPTTPDATDPQPPPEPAVLAAAAKRYGVEIVG